MDNNERIINDFIKMVNISSPSLNERKIADFILKELQELGIKAYEDEVYKEINGNAGNVITVIEGNKKGRILFSAHMDTVNPCEKIEPVIDGDIIKSDGSTVLGGDDKGGIAAILGFLRELKNKKGNHVDVVAVFSVAEEIGLYGAKNLDIEELGNVEYAYVLDGEGKVGVAYNKAPYSAKGEIKIIGKEAHAGINPENGINAFVIAADAVSKLKIGRVDNDTTCNIGKVNGGIATNIVMPSISLLFECRSLEEKKLDKLINKVKNTFSESCKYFSGELIFNVKKGTPGFYISEEENILKLFKKACYDLSIDYSTISSGGGSDTNIYNKYGIKAINIAVGMENVHTKSEFINKNDILKSAELLMKITENYLQYLE